MLIAILPLSASFAVTKKSSHGKVYRGIASMTPIDADNFSGNFDCKYQVKLTIQGTQAHWEASRLSSDTSMNEQCPGKGDTHYISIDSKVFKTSSPNLVNIPHYYNGQKNNIIYVFNPKNTVNPLETYGFFDNKRQMFNDGNRRFGINECYGDAYGCDIR